MNIGTISLIANCITAGATLGLLLVAWRALNSWRDEMRAKPAAEMLAGVYRLRTRIEHARSWDPTWSESLKQEPGESKDDARRRSMIRWPITTLFDEASAFNEEFADRRYRFQALFGPKADKPIQELQEIERDVGCRIQPKEDLS